MEKNWSASDLATASLEKRNLKNEPVKINLPEDDLSRFLITAPPMKGAEYVNEDSLHLLWKEIESAIQAEILNSGKDISDYFASRHSSLSLLGRVCFHLAENIRLRHLSFFWRHMPIKSQKKEAPSMCLSIVNR